MTDNGCNSFAFIFLLTVKDTEHFDRFGEVWRRNSIIDQRLINFLISFINLAIWFDCSGLRVGEFRP